MDQEAESVLTALAGKRPGNPIRKTRADMGRIPRRRAHYMWTYICPWCGSHDERITRRFMTRKIAKDKLHAHSLRCPKWPKEQHGR